MASKSLVFLITMLLASTMSASHVKPQLLGNLPLLGGLLSNTIINGTIFCTPNGNIGAIGSATPRFANATVQLICGGQNVLASTVTNALGSFTFVLSPIQALLSSVLTSCNVVVLTPLSSCNPLLPSQGILQAALQLVRTILQGLFNVVVLSPTLFQLV